MFFYKIIERAIKPVIEKFLKVFPAIVILGPGQAGKTTLIKLLAAKNKKETMYLDLEKTSDFDKLNRDAEEYLLSYLNECVLIDEIQRMPSLFPLLRAVIDEKRKPGRFIITGSASFALLKGAPESLAGRVAYFYLHPIGLHELPAAIPMNKHWFRGGFPQALTIRNNQLLQGWLDSFITTYIERDLPFLFDIRFSTSTMRRLWSMLAHLQGSILNAENLGNSLDVTGTTAKRYLDYLEAAFIITRLQPYFINIGKRLIKAPKIYINDSGILHYLLRLHAEKELLNHPAVGASWEGYIVSQVLYAKDSRLDMYYYCTQAGAECDLVLVRGHVVKACVEIKLSKAPVATKGFFQCIKDLKSKNNFIVCSADVDYINKQGIRIVGAAIFINKYLAKL
ncbi:ATP-binding protein [Ferruginibacter sp.]|uniref:ATP-binding protein n=1 Tax=Ferruginibacter sp. TaxID=1940288 RepID=UPI00265872BC|nr:ATP-binding protein [Ferruginibacter sp.]